VSVFVCGCVCVSVCLCVCVCVCVLSVPPLTPVQQLLGNTAAGTFLVRVAESRFGYSLSHWCVLCLMC
jgi:hypothetical protein